MNMGSLVRIRFFHILHFVRDLLFPLLKNSKDEFPVIAEITRRQFFHWKLGAKTMSAIIT